MNGCGNKKMWQRLGSSCHGD